MVAGKQKTDRSCFDHAQLVSSDWLVPLEIALIYLHYRIPSRALQRAQAAIQQAASVFYAWFILGQCQQELGFIEAARTSYTRCLELSPRHFEAGVRMAELGRGSWSATVRRWLRLN